MTTRLLAATVPSTGLRFGSAEVLNLADRERDIANADALAVVQLDATVAAAILAAPVVDEEHPSLTFSEQAFGCRPGERTCVPAHERGLIDASLGKVKRDGRQLVVAANDGKPLQFIDFTQPSTRKGDGDSETHWYLGTLPGNGYHRVEVQFGHDAPGNFLINPGDGGVAFVHNGSDVVAPSPDGRWLVTFNSINPPASVRVADLDITGPRLTMTCAAAKRSVASVQMKGWHDAAEFDLVLFPTGKPGVDAIPLRLARGADGWQIAMPDPARATTLEFGCRQRSSS
ncbi:MAG: hypothetical protein ABIR62_14135 [Dokdonella sp.]|uniref:hypothetical protein n=1 Tax=Dokdonella sp. TaxID=2291710 RepID=UPI003265ECFD